MAESTSHRQAKQKAAGKKGKTEVPLLGGGKLDARTSNRATEIERSDTPARLRAAAKRLDQSGAKQKVLAVPHYIQIDMYRRKLKKGYLLWGGKNPVQRLKTWLIYRQFCKCTEG